MRRITAIIIGIIFAIGMHARTYVLATGISNYGRENANLTQTTEDTKNFVELMKLQTKDVTTLTGKNVTKGNVLEKLRAICNRAQKGDRIVFFYSGHGRKGGLYGYDQPIPYREITDILSRSKASEKIVYIDACYAGTMAEDTENGGLKSMPNTVIFVSSRPDEISIESEILGAGFFTQALLAGLRGKSDTNHDRKITVMELFKYIRGDVMRRSREMQHPQLIAPKDMHNTVLMSW